MKRIKDLFQYIYVKKTGRDLYFRTYATLKADKRSIISVGLAYKYLNFLHDFSDRRKYICVNRMRAIVYEAYNEIEEEVPDCYWDIVKVVLEQTYYIFIFIILYMNIVHYLKDSKPILAIEK